MKVGVNAIERKRDSVTLKFQQKRRRRPRTASPLRLRPARRAIHSDGMLKFALKTTAADEVLRALRSVLEQLASAEAGRKSARQRTRLSYMCGQPPRLSVERSSTFRPNPRATPNQRLVTSRAQPSAILLNPHIGKTFSSAVCFPFFRALSGRFRHHRRVIV